MVRNARAFTLTLTLALALGLAACGGDEQVAPPTPTPTPVSFNVTPCLNQIVAQDRTLANLLVPDVVRLDLTQPAGFPNGRRYLDPVVDVTLAAALLDLRVHSPNTFASIPLNPNTVDQPLTATFPFLAPPLGTPPLATGAGSNFVFRTNPASAYTRVDRMGMPAVATALIFPGGSKSEYNDDTPAVDATGKWMPQMTEQLQFYHAALADDFRALGLIACAVPN
jgi:Domain of unknown function (DUF4331)